MANAIYTKLLLESTPDVDGQVTETQSVQQAANLVAMQHNADVIHYNGPIQRPADQLLIDDFITRCRRKNALLILVTMGGDTDAAYRIARCLQDKYERFSLYVSGCCKSAGTLVALGAHELIMSDHGELGPLNVRMPKKDEIWQTQSELRVMDTLAALQDNAHNAFKKFSWKQSREAVDQSLPRRLLKSLRR